MRVFTQARSGVAAARNRGVREARGAYLCFLDADDLVAPGKIEAQAAALEARHDAGVAYADSDYLVPAAGGRWEVVRVGEGTDDVRRSLLRGECPFQIHSALFRRSAVDRVAGFPAEFPRAEDIALYARLLAAGVLFLHQPEPRGLYRRRPGSLSADDAEMTRGRRAVATWLLAHMPGLTTAERRFLRLHARYLSVMLGRILAAQGRARSARAAYLSSLRFGRGPGEVLEVLRCLLSPNRASGRR